MAWRGVTGNSAGMMGRGLAGLWCGAAALLGVGVGACGGASGVASDGSSAAREMLAPAEVRMDGVVDEWLSMPSMAEDPAGDATGAFDVTRVWACSRGAMLFVAFEMTGELSLQSGPRDEGRLVLEIGTPDGSVVAVDFRGRVVWRSAGGAEGVEGADAEKLSWVDVGMLQMPTYASRVFELRFDLGRFGVEVGSEVTLDFAGSDGLDAPVRFRLAAGHVEPSDRPVGPGTLARAAGSGLRVASYNTEHNGLRDEKSGDRREAIRRVVRAVAADVYCIQEEWTASADTLRRVFEEIDPTGDGSGWSVVFDNGAAVATRLPMVALPDIPDVRAAGAVVKTGEGAGDAVVVYSVHLKCCGHIGSDEDARRIEEAGAIAAQVAALRAGELGAEFVAYAGAPVLIAGDYNLVGSRVPLTVMEERMGVRSLELPHMLSDAIYTWYEEGSEFAPGKLDYITVSDGLRQVRGFVVNPRHFGEAMSRQMGIRRDDVSATDHLMMVTDLVVE